MVDAEHPLEASVPTKYGTIVVSGQLAHEYKKGDRVSAIHEVEAAIERRKAASLKPL